MSPKNSETAQITKSLKCIDQQLAIIFGNTYKDSFENYFANTCQGNYNWFCNNYYPQLKLILDRARIQLACSPINLARATNKLCKELFKLFEISTSHLKDQSTQELQNVTQLLKQELAYSADFSEASQIEWLQSTLTIKDYINWSKFAVTATEKQRIADSFEKFITKPLGFWQSLWNILWPWSSKKDTRISKFIQSKEHILNLLEAAGQKPKWDRCNPKQF
jgi:hypothetical protein